MVAPVVEPALSGEPEVRPDADRWASPQEMDHATDWDDEDEMESEAGPEFDAGPSHGSEGMVDPGDVEPELVPVAASVFDDDFFRTPSERNRIPGETEFFGSAVAVQAASAPAPVEENAREVRLFAGASGSPAEHSETDELDIPAFLRRSR
jgi:cell division protein FtsZ